MSGVDWALVALVGAGVIVGLVVAAAVLVPLVRAGAWLVRRVWKFVSGELVDVVRLVGAIVAAVIFAVAAVFNVILGRQSSVGHYLKALESEGEVLGGCLYRTLVGHPAKLLGLSPLTEILERRVPMVLATSPGGSGARAGKFDGYTIVGTLPPGGSGARLFIATPGPEKQAEFRRAGQEPPERVVIKSFILGEQSTLPQIIRESRALTAASQLGLVLDHSLSDAEFHYVTRYQPGESLTAAIRTLHSESGPSGLSQAALRQGLGYIADLLLTLRDYHAASLWHKDVKPDNIIVSEGVARLVDFGLITPLRSGLTLTTHGTEYFRDPEMVRLAIKGTKVHEVDGARFDVYGAGAVLYSLGEGTFPAHGGLSRVSKACPDALRWIITRAMAEYDKRYPSAAAMLADVRALVASEDLFAVRIGALPSVAELAGDSQPMVAADAVGSSTSIMPAHAAATRPSSATVSAVAAPTSVVPAPAARPPRLRVSSWWTGRYEVQIDGPSDDAGRSGSASGGL